MHASRLLLTAAKVARLGDRMLENVCQRTQSRRIGWGLRRVGTLLNRWRHFLQVLHFALAQVRSLGGLDRLLQIRDLIRWQGL
jgi:uncharacterized alpha-E superfamily protein